MSIDLFVFIAKSGGKIMNKKSQRVIETKERIKNAFFELYAKKKIERISIKEITDKAEINRGTFYVYYKDIYDLLEKTENELIEEMLLKLKDIIAIFRHVESIEPYLPFEFYQRNSKYLRVLLGENGNPNFVYKMKSVFKEAFGELFKTEKNIPIQHHEYVMEYILAAQIGVISFWLSKDMELPVAELGEMIRKITLLGPINFLMTQVETVYANSI